MRFGDFSAHLKVWKADLSQTVCSLWCLWGSQHAFRKSRMNAVIYHISGFKRDCECVCPHWESVLAQTAMSHAGSVTAVSLACYPHPPTQPLSLSLTHAHTHRRTHTAFNCCGWQTPLIDDANHCPLLSSTSTNDTNAHAKYTNAVAKHKNVPHQYDKIAQTSGSQPFTQPVKKSTRKLPRGSETDKPDNARRVDSAVANFHQHGGALYIHTKGQ